MRTTLKRGIGRATALNGNGHAVLPPTVLSPVNRYTQPSRRRRGWVRVLRFLAGLFAFGLLLVLGSAGGAYLYFHQSVAAVAAHSADVKIASKALDITLPNQPAIALVIGYDHRKGDKDRGRTDTMMLLRADPTTNAISMLSIPRDLIAPLWCGERQHPAQRINMAYDICGSKGALDTLKKLTGLPINYLITVDFMGFVQIVNRVGGVWIDVDRRYYNKNVGTEATNYSSIDLQPGYQRLKGGKALAYVRYRHTDNDFFRIARQQQFVKAMKQQISANFSLFTALKLVGTITHNVEIGQAGGGGSLDEAIKRYAWFAYRLPSGHFFQAKIDNIEGTNELTASSESIAAAVHDFETPDVEAPAKSAAVVLGRKAVKLKALPPSRTSISVLNGNGATGSASTAASELGRLGYQIVVGANESDRNAPNFNYFHTKVYFDKRYRSARVSGRRVANLFADADLAPLPRKLRKKSLGALLTVVVGHTFHGTLAPAPSDTTPKKQPPYVREDPSQSESLLKNADRHVGFPLMVPTILERSSSIDREVPIRVYSLKKGERAVRLTFLAGSELAGYWGIEETPWTDAPVLQQPNFEHVIDGRPYNFYYSGPHLHMVVLRTKKASYWVVNTLDDAMSNETMISIAKGLKPLR